MTPEGAAIRKRVDPRDVPPAKAARRLHLTLEQFEAKKEELFDRGFPQPDPTTGNYDLVKIDLWMDDRDTSTRKDKASNAREVVPDRLARM